MAAPRSDPLGVPLANHNSFADEDGVTLILNATSGAGEVGLQFVSGLDVRGINGVINYGIPAKVPIKTQRDGRGGRSTDEEAFCINMVKPWVLDMDIGTVPVDTADPDKPLLEAGLTKKVPMKRERTGRASLHIATSDDCQRVLCADYYGDDSPEEAMTARSSALKRKCTTKYRPTKDRPAILKLLGQWLSNKLSMVHPSTITSPASITALLEQSPEWDGLWAEGVYKILAAAKQGRPAVSAELSGESSEGSSSDDEPQTKRKK
ncbi:hypothetical protein C8J57DRAFT_1236524 [Mycena rebaudengoi]|nr:hypothetical protein C8J57DRAFT_1236524 [Mycena rebaudengoi]